MTAKPRAGELDPWMVANIDQNRSKLKRHIDALMESAREAFLDHGDAAEPMLCVALVEQTRYPIEVMAAFVAHLAIAEVKRVSDAAH